jgi:predicted aspartyl protease
MSRTLTFDYNRAYSPSAPFIDVVIDGYDSDKAPVTISAFVDSGADGTMLPYDILSAVGAEYADTVLLRGTAGGVQRLDRYSVRIRVGEQEIHSISSVAIAAGSEPLIGRDVLNQLIVTLNGLAEMMEIQIEWGD